jgi:hypothetical protein
MNVTLVSAVMLSVEWSLHSENFDVDRTEQRIQA